MCYGLPREKLLSFGLSDLKRILRREGYSLQALDRVLDPESGSYVRIPLNWTTTNGFSGAVEKKGNCSIYVYKDSGGLYLEIRYSLQSGDKILRDITLRYNLVRKESNLKPGTYRYYIVDPFADPEQGGGLCTKLYLLPATWEFVPGSVLKTYGVLYSDQRKGHKERYYFGSRKIPETKYRKSHYRGKLTPFWYRYESLRDREEEKFMEFCIGMGTGRGLISQAQEMEFMLAFRRHTGRDSPRKGIRL